MNAKVKEFHPIHIERQPAGQELGRALGRLRYDKLQEVLVGLADEIIEQGQADEARGRMKLAMALNLFGTALSDASWIRMQVVRDICNPYIEAEKNDLKKM